MGLESSLGEMAARYRDLADIVFVGKAVYIILCWLGCIRSARGTICHGPFSQDRRGGFDEADGG